MATEFDKGGFAAVAAFFGKTETNENVCTRIADDVSTPRQITQRGNRSGLGASKEKTVQGEGVIGELGLDDARKKILGLGRSNRRRGAREDDELSNGGTESESGSEEEGRTSAVKPKAKRSINASDRCSEPPKKKRKKSKGQSKESGATNSDSSAAEEVVDKSALNQAVRESTDTDVQKSGAFKETPIAAEMEETEGIVRSAARKKRRRPKIRSRQKNIRKDAREAADKPAHLILGRSNFAGRPLTPETRAHLNLPKNITCRRHTAIIEQGQDGQKIGPRMGGGHGGGDLGLVLAVDDFLDVEHTVSKQHEKRSDKQSGKKSPKRSSTHQGKPKKSKYKNLTS